MFHIETVRRVELEKLARPGYLEKTGDPSTRDLARSESKLLKVSVINFRAWASNGFCALGLVNFGSVCGRTDLKNDLVPFPE